MIRKIIHIDEEKCTGCGICADACHEGAIEIIDGKAKLVRENFCDGFGDCLPVCPAGAITFEMREAPEYDETAVKQARESREKDEMKACPVCSESSLSNWPVQIKLAPVQAPYFNNAKLLVAADCTAYAYAAFHEDFIRDKITLIGCPKLDDIDYSRKLTEIISGNDIKSVTVVRMEVPCCGGIEAAVKKAIQSAQKVIPCQIITIGKKGNIKQ